MIRLALLVLCFSCWLAWGDERPTGQHYYPHGGHGTVCIEIRPAGQQTPTKVCGPVAHGGMQSQQQQHQSQQQQQSQQQHTQQQQRLDSPPDTMVASVQRTIDPSDMILQGEPKGAVPPCNRGYPRMPMFVPRAVGEGMMAMGVPLDMEGMGWRQASPPCPHDHAMRSMPMPPPPAMLPFQAPFPPTMLTGSWLKAFRSAEEDSTAPKSAESKEEFGHLLKECDEKTKILREKEKEIADLKGKMSDSKKEPNEKQPNGKNQMSNSQMKN